MSVFDKTQLTPSPDCRQAWTIEYDAQRDVGQRIYEQYGQ